MLNVDCVARVAEITLPSVSTLPTIEDDEPSVPLEEMSYSDQFEELYKRPLNARVAVPKPSKQAQAQEIEGKKVLLSDVVATPKRPLINRTWNSTDLFYGGFVGLMHIGCLFAPSTFSWPMVGLCMGMYFVTGCLGITLSYHRYIYRIMKCFTSVILLMVGVGCILAHREGACTVINCG